MAATISPSEAQERLDRFDRVERIAHWTTAALFLIAMATAAALYVGQLSALVGRRALMKDVHVLSGLALLGLAPSVPAAVPIPKAPAIDARSYLLMDYESGRVLGESRADERMEPASLTKLMTAYAVFKALKENRL